MITHQSSAYPQQYAKNTTTSSIITHHIKHDNPPNHIKHNFAGNIANSGYIHQYRYSRKKFIKLICEISIPGKILIPRFEIARRLGEKILLTNLNTLITLNVLLESFKSFNSDKIKSSKLASTKKPSNRFHLFLAYPLGVNAVSLQIISTTNIDVNICGQNETYIQYSIASSKPPKHRLLLYAE